VATLGEEAVAYSIVTQYRREEQVHRGDAALLSDAISPHIDEPDEATLSALEELMFFLVRQLARATRLLLIAISRDRSPMSAI
jgi:hypothetical protein